MSIEKQEGSRYDLDVADAKARGITDGPHGWIQWKGTNVCLDVRCSCGFLGHVDAEFVYHVRCGACGRRYIVSAHVALIPIDYEPKLIVDTDAPTKEGSKR